MSLPTRRRRPARDHLASASPRAARGLPLPPPPRPAQAHTPPGCLMKLLFVADPLDTFKIYKDSTFAMMREASRRGHTLWATQPVTLRWRRGGRVQARALPIVLTGVEGHSHEPWYTTTGPETVILAEFHAVLMR